MSGFARIFRGLVDSFPSSGAGPTSAPSQLSDEVSLVHEISNAFSRIDERRIINVVSVAPATVLDFPPAPINRYQYVFGASGFHNEGVGASRPIEFYILDTVAFAIAIQLTTSRPNTFLANQIFSLSRPVIVPPRALLRIFVDGLAGGGVISGSMMWIECPFQDIPTGP